MFELGTKGADEPRDFQALRNILNHNKPAQTTIAILEFHRPSSATTTDKTTQMADRRKKLAMNASEPTLKASQLRTRQK
jgi:hypothetical protein